MSLPESSSSEREPTRELLLAQALDACIEAERHLTGSSDEVIGRQPAWARAELHQLVSLAAALDAAAGQTVIADDFRVAAAIMKGKKLAPHTRMMINPGSRETYLQAMHEGLIDIMIEAGATIGVPGCGPCSGCHQGMLAPGENAITNASRNFKGRFGSPEASAYVASSATVAASAIAGRIVSPAKPKTH